MSLMNMLDALALASNGEGAVMHTVDQVRDRLEAECGILHHRGDRNDLCPSCIEAVGEQQEGED